MTHLHFTCAAFEAQLPEYLEGSASDSALADAELHLAACEPCRSLVADLREIARQAAALPGIVPSRDLWPEIEARTQPRVLPLASAPARPLRTRWRMGAIAAGLVGITVLSTYLLTADRDGRTPAVASSAAVAPVSTPASGLPAVAPGSGIPAAAATGITPVARSVRPVRPEAGVTYASEISRLRDVLADRSNDLDPATIAILQSSVATIDSAIVQAREALRRDPASRFLTQQLNKSLERKLGVLRTAALLSPST